jgi:hypothetical protein
MRLILAAALFGAAVLVSVAGGGFSITPVALLG